MEHPLSLLSGWAKEFIAIHPMGQKFVRFWSAPKKQIWPFSCFLRGPTLDGSTTSFCVMLLRSGL